MTYETALTIDSWILVGISLALLVLIIVWIASVIAENIRERRFARNISYTKEFEQQTQRKIEILTTEIAILKQQVKRLQNDKNS